MHLFKIVVVSVLTTDIFCQVPDRVLEGHELAEWLLEGGAEKNMGNANKLGYNTDPLEEDIQPEGEGDDLGDEDGASDEEDYAESSDEDGSNESVTESQFTYPPNQQAFPFPMELPVDPDAEIWTEQAMNAGWWNGPNVCNSRREFIDGDQTIRTYNHKRLLRKAYTRRHGIPYRQNREEETLLNYMTQVQTNTTCEEYWEKYNCETRTTYRGMLKISVTSYSCCLNYALSGNQSRCVRLPRVKIMDTLRDMEHKKFLEVLQLENVDRMLNENITIFLPTDDALDRFRELQYSLDVEKIKETDGDYDEDESEGIDVNYNDNYVENDEYEDDRRYMKRRIIPKFTLRNYGGKVYTGKDLVLNHIVKMPLNLRTVFNNDIFMSLFNDSPLRVNIYANGENSNLVLINCVPVKQANIQSLGGTINIMDGVITPIKFTMFDQILESTKVRTFGKLVRNNNQIHRLLDLEKAYTLLMPTDEAFERLPRLIQRHIAEATECGLAILRNHIITDILCGGAIAPSVQARTLEGNVITFERISDVIIIDGKANVTTADIMATNGIIHMVDEFLIPEKGMLLTQILEKYDLSTFHETIDSFAGLADTWNALSNRTFFIPNNKALSGGLLSSLEKKGDMESYLSLFGYYMTPKLLKVEHTANNQLLRTILNEKSRINLYSKTFNGSEYQHVTWNCAEIVHTNIHCCGFMVHIINKFLLPPSFTIYNVLSSSPQFTILRRVLRNTEVKSIINNRWTSLTFLAPTDTFFRALHEYDYKIFMRNRIKANEVFLHHLFSDVMCCSGLSLLAESESNAFAESYAGKKKEIYVEKKGIKVGSTMITRCDIMASNGVIHEVNSIMTNNPFLYSELTYFEYGLI